MDLDEYRKESLENWNRLSDNWRDEREFILGATAPIANDLIARLDPQPGQTILDVAAGTGDTGYQVAERLGDEGKLITTDFSPAMLDHARAVAEERGVTNVEHRVLDAEQMDLEDDSVDGVLCRWGYMLMADPAKALAETRRVLRDGGRIALSVWAAPDRNLWAALVGMEMMARGHVPPPEPGDPGIFGLADADQLRQLIEGAGFSNVEVEEMSFTWPYVDADEHWRLMLKLAGPLADAIQNLDDSERDSVRESIQEKVEPLLSGGEGIEGVCHNATAS